MKKKPTPKRDRFTWPKIKDDAEERATQAIDQAYDVAAWSIRHFMLVCKKHNNPIRCLTYRVLDNGETKCHVTYRRVKKVV